jgi:hypothetical protein
MKCQKRTVCCVSLLTLGYQYSLFYSKTPSSRVITFGSMLESDIIQMYIDRENTMNRRKKANQILKSRVKKANAKLNPNNKYQY